MMDRREFTKRAVSATIAAAGIGSASSLSSCRSPEGKEEPSIPASAEELSITDTHQHLWDLEKFQPPWLETAPPVLARSYVTKDYLAAAEGTGIDRAVYMEVDVAPDQQVAEAEHVIALSRSDDHPTMAAIISGRPGSEGFRAYIEKLAGSPEIKGVRQVLHVPSAPKSHCLTETFVSSMKLLGELNLNFDFCIRPTELADAAALARKCPGTRFVVDHCGNADPKAFGALAKTTKEEPWHDEAGWRRDIAELAQIENVYCKISGIVARAPKGSWNHETLAPIVNHCLDEFGPDRVCFGSDWPVCNLTASLRDWVAALRTILGGRSLEDQEKLLSKNAAKIYRLA